MPEIVDLTPADASELTTLYREYDWWADRDVEDVCQALESTDVAVGLRNSSGGDDDDRLVAAARVVTDFVYYAMVYDVIVAADRRGEGLGDALVSTVVGHAELAELPRLALLARRGLIPYYESVGFEVFDQEIDVPEGGTEELVRMTYEYERSDPDDEARD
jgi:predicted GNAT family N-acyltransferase